MGHSHFHLRKRNVPGNSEEKPGQDSLSHFKPPTGRRADPTDGLRLEGYRGVRAAHHWVGF